MNIITSNDLRIANMGTLYTPHIDLVMPQIEHSANYLAGMMASNDSQLMQDAMTFHNYYNSADVVNQINDLTNQTGYSHDPYQIIFNGDFNIINEYTQEILLHTDVMYQGVQNGTLEGYGYEYQEDIHRTAIYNNLHGNLATPTKEAYLFVDSSEHDITHDDLMHVNDMVEQAILKLNDENIDVTKGNK